MKIASVSFALLSAAALVSGSPINRSKCRPSASKPHNPDSGRYPIAMPGGQIPGSDNGSSYPYVPVPAPGGEKPGNVPSYPTVPEGDKPGNAPSYPTIPGDEKPGNGTGPSYHLPPSNPDLPAKKKNTMTVLATNDIHTHLDQFNKGGTDCRQKDIDANSCFGGAARIQYMVSKFRSEKDDVVLLDAGDQFQGTLFFNVYGGEKTAEIMNQLKYDAMCIGNHEFDNGIDYVSQFFRNLTFPVVSSNIDYSTAPQLTAAGVKPYIVLKEYGVGIIGYITNTTSQITTGARNVKFNNPASAVQRYVDELHAQGVKRIICVSHNGYEHDQWVAQNTRGINLIVGGHSHSLLLNNASAPGVQGPYPTKVTNLDNKDTYIVQSHRYGDYLGHVSLAWNDADELISLTGESVLLDQTIPIDNSTAAKVAEWRKGFDSLTKRIVGRAEGRFDNAGCGVAECAIGNMISDAMLENRRGAGGDIVFTNAGGIRAAFEAGDITYADVLTVLPFGNTIVQFLYTGKEVLDLLERVAAGHSKTGTTLTSIPQWAGIKWSYDPAAPEYQRVKSALLVKADGTTEPIDATKTYQMVTNDFVAGGGDGIIDRVDVPPGDLQADALITYLEKKGVVSPVLEGRVVKIGA